MKTATSDQREAVDTALIPKSKAEQIAAVTCNAVLDYFSQPGVQEQFEAWLLERNSRKEVNYDGKK